MKMLLIIATFIGSLSVLATSPSSGCVLKILPGEDNSEIPLTNNLILFGYHSSYRGDISIRQREGTDLLDIKFEDDNVITYDLDEFRGGYKVLHSNGDHTFLLGCDVKH